MEKKASAERAVREIRRKMRRRFSAEEKIRIVTERWIESGKLNRHCHTDRQARHGPYYQWSWRTRGRTVSVYLDDEQATLCKKRIKNNRRLESTIRRIRALSLRAARLHEIPRK